MLLRMLEHEWEHFVKLAERLRRPLLYATSQAPSRNQYCLHQVRTLAHCQRFKRFHVFLRQSTKPCYNVELVGQLPRAFGQLPKIGDLFP
jgi:hypothetical protein